MLFFAAKIVLVFVTVIGAEFHSLVASPIKVLGVLLVLNFSHVAFLVVAEESNEGLMKDLQKTQNKMLRFLNKSKIKDKISTKSILENMNMLSVNQTNAQIKLTETWKALNNKNSCLQNLKRKECTGSRLSRSVTNGELKEEGVSNLARKSFQNDSSRLWNKASQAIKSSSSLYTAKKK